MEKKNGNGVTQAPKDADQGCMPDTTLTTYNRRDSDDMVGIGRVAHAEKKAKSNYGEQWDHIFSNCGGTRMSPPPVVRATDSTELLVGAVGIERQATPISPIASRRCNRPPGTIVQRRRTLEHPKYA